MSSRGVEKQIRKLREAGIIQRVGADYGGRWEIIKDKYRMGDEFPNSQTLSNKIDMSLKIWCNKVSIAYPNVTVNHNAFLMFLIQKTREDIEKSVRKCLVWKIIAIFAM